MSKKQEYNYVQLLNFIEDAEYVNPWIGECILRFIRENGSIKIDLKYVSPNEVDMTLSNGRECKVRCVNRTAWVEYQS
mgnify:CR=1 FL=1